MNNLVKTIYGLYYASGANSSALALYYKLIYSPWVAKWLFQMKVLSHQELSNTFTKIPIHFSLTTILLKKTSENKLRQAPELKVLEIGVGAFAILSGYLSRWTKQTIDAVDINMSCIESAKKHVELNKVNVRVLWSDLFASLPGYKYDLIVWNLPGTKEANLPELYHKLFKVAPDYMNDNAQILLAYNNRDSKRDDIRASLAKYAQLHEYEIKTWWWNIHDVFIIAKKSEN